MYSLIEFFVGFQNIIKLLKPDEQNLNYKHLKLIHLGTVTVSLISDCP